MSPFRFLLEVINVQWNAFKDIQLYEYGTMNITVSEFLIGFFILFCLAGFINMFMHRGE